jgi:ABC-type histidine transport system ATPase subunit
MSPTDSPVVEITALRKSYGANEVLKGIDIAGQNRAR